MKKRITNSFLVSLGIGGLIYIRYAESNLFYDPFLDYFHQVGQNPTFPTFNWGQLIISHFLRFGLNLIFSSIIIHFIFNKIKWTLYGGILMSLVFGVTLLIYLYCLYTQFEVGVSIFVLYPSVCNTTAYFTAHYSHILLFKEEKYFTIRSKKSPHIFKGIFYLTEHFLSFFDSFYENINFF